MKASATAVIDGGGGGRGGSNESQMAGCLVCAHVATKDAVLYEGPKSRPKGYVGEDYCRVVGGHVVTFFSHTEQLVCIRMCTFLACT